MWRFRYSWLAEQYQSLSDGLNALESLCAQVLADHNRQQEEQQQQEQQQQEEEEQTAASELRQFLLDGGLADQDENLGQALQGLEAMCTEALQQSPTTSTAMQG